MNLTRMRTFGWVEYVTPIMLKWKLHIPWGDQVRYYFYDNQSVYRSVLPVFFIKVGFSIFKVKKDLFNKNVSCDSFSDHFSLVLYFNMKNTELAAPILM